MGSLMAGWDSPVYDPRSVGSERNKSLTKEEIEAYWRSKKKAEEEHLTATTEILMKTSQYEPERKLVRSSSLPLPNNERETEKSLAKLIKEKGWWTWSNSAFLNEPPVLEPEGRPTHNYASQFHVAAIGSSNSDDRPWN